MSVKYVNEYVEEMCDICHNFKYGVFVNLNNTQVCESCCKELNKQLKIYELQNE